MYESIYLFQSGVTGITLDIVSLNKSEQNNMKSYLDKKNKDNVEHFMYRSIEDHNCLINKRYFICYNKKQIKYWSLMEAPNDQNKTMAEFEIDKYSTAVIKSVRASSNPDQISIIVN